MSYEDPLKQLVKTLKILENHQRAACLISVYLGQRADQNTIQGISGIYSALQGKDSETSSAMVKRYITKLVNIKLLERERERMISQTKVSFHQISPLGEIALLYACIFLIDNPVELMWDKLEFTSYMSGDSEFKLARYLVNSFLSANKHTERIIDYLKEGTDPQKLRVGKTIDLGIPRIFGGNTGHITFKILEELIWDHVNLNIGISRSELDSHFEVSIGSNLKRLAPFISEDEVGRTKYYRLSTSGLFILPVLALLIRQCSVDYSILPSILSNKIDSEQNAWITMVNQARNFFKGLYRLS